MRALFGLIMKRLLIAAIALFLSHQATHAVTITVAADETPANPALILIKGQFMSGEDKKDTAAFSSIAAIQKKPAIVFLDSTGGIVWTALQIGMAIRRYGFSTAVADNTQCSSACALAWMSGKERFMGKNAHIGFHAAKFADKPEVSHSAQAIIGAYLHEVGVKDLRAVIFLTSASPDSMIWLSPNDAARYGIPITMFSFSQDGWSWAREALTGSGPRPHVDPPAPVLATRPAASTFSERTQTQVEKPAEPNLTGRVTEQSPAAGVQSVDLIAQALRRIENGDLAGARELLAAAEDGSQGLVSFALAETYDPNMLAAWGTRGVASDITRARALYRKALNLGVAIAHERLEALK